MMVALGQNATAPSGNAIDRARARPDRHHPASERLVIVGFDDQMGVISWSE
jgi:hypothetical protein